MTMKKIAFQGLEGAYSDLACRQAYPKFATLPCPSFADVFAAVEKGKADLGMIPVDNSTAGRVADIHHLLPESSLSIVGEFFLPVHHCLLGVGRLSDLKYVRSHAHALPQCRKIIRTLKLKPIVFADTARSAEEVARLNDPAHGAIASELAAKIYGLKILKRNVEDEAHNTTRFLVLSREKKIRPRGKMKNPLTSLVFQVRNIPAALYKGLGGFATNGVNMSKLESYMPGGRFASTQFYCELEGHPEDQGMKLALEELAFFASELRIMGVYSAHPFRRKGETA